MLQQVVGLSRKVGPLFGWCDNYDLMAFTPNGRREIHRMALQFMCHPSGDFLPGSACSEKTSPLIIPWLQKFAAAKLSLTDIYSVTMLHYNGPKKVNPLSVSNHIGLPFKDVCKLNESVTQAHLDDMKWLLTLFNTDGDEYPLERSGYMTTLSRDHHVTSPKPFTPLAFGPLINAPPSHPDTIVKTLDYCKNYLQSLGMNTIHITLDMQLYMVAIQVKWSDPEKWATLVMHPGGMHCVMSFLGCIGKLMT